jgi:hypothetical protein
MLENGKELNDEDWEEYPSINIFEQHPYKTDGVTSIQTIAPFRRGDKDHVSKLGEVIRDAYLDYDVIHNLAEPALSHPRYYRLNGIDAVDLYFRTRINYIFTQVYVGLHIEYEHANEDNEFVWSFVKKGYPQRRFGAMFLVEQGYIHPEEFMRITATSDEEEAEFANNSQLVSDSGVSLAGQRILKGLCNLYNNYGCRNIAVSDFEHIIMIDMQPQVAPEHPGRLPKLVIFSGGWRRNTWREFQAAWLGFLDRGCQWELSMEDE